MAEFLVSIAGAAKIIGIVGSVEALDTRKIQPQEVFITAIAGQGPGHDDVVHCENCLEVEGTVAVLIELVV